MGIRLDHLATLDYEGGGRRPAAHEEWEINLPQVMRRERVLVAATGEGRFLQSVSQLLGGKDETPGIKDLGSVLHNSYIQTLCLPRITLFSPMDTRVGQ